MKQIQRRKFLRTSLIAGTGVFLAPNFVSCKKDDPADKDIPGDLTTKYFDHGVASFDPTTEGFLIWTRYAKEGTLRWQISTDQDFSSVVRENDVQARSDRDFTVSVEVTEMTPGTKYFYRFVNIADKTVSPVGRTLTFDESPNSLKIATCSCANYQAGLFNIYGAIAESDADVVIHLGDYIYEYAIGEYGTNDTTARLGRQHEPAHEIISLDDYRTRYKQYRSDKDLQLAHQMKPFICVWDDHEITNDTYKDGAENHDDSEGDFEVRKAHAIQAYSEFLPVRTKDTKLIYRSIQLGNLVNLIMLDTRVIGRDKQLSYTDYFSESGVDFQAFQRDLFDRSRSILGQTQRDWAVGQLSTNTATWQVLGQQVLMGKILIPTEMLFQLFAILQERAQTGNISPATLQRFQQSLQQLVIIKSRLLNGDTTLTAEEKARVTTVAPYNLDAWDGYPVEREIILKAATGKKLITLAGDTHNGWASKLTTAEGVEVGTEVATSSVTSPGLESYLGLPSAQVAAFEQALELLIDDLSYLNGSQRGYCEIEFTASSANAKWKYINTIASEEYTIVTQKTENIA